MPAAADSLAAAGEPVWYPCHTGSRRAEAPSILFPPRHSQLVELRSLQGHTLIDNSITGLAFTPDGKHILSCALDSTVRLWDVATGAEVRQFRGHKAGVTGLALTADGKKLATGFEAACNINMKAEICIWNLERSWNSAGRPHLVLPHGPKVLRDLPE